MCCVASKHVHVQRCSRIAPKAIERETAKRLWHGFVKQFPSCGVRRTVQFVNLKSMDHTHTAPTHTGRPEALLITGFCLKSASGHGWTECIDVEDDYIERLIRDFLCGLCIWNCLFQNCFIITAKCCAHWWWLWIYTLCLKKTRH